MVGDRWRRQTGTYILGDSSDIARVAEDQVIALQNMRNSKFKLPMDLLEVRVAVSITACAVVRGD